MKIYVVDIPWRESRVFQRTTHRQRCTDTFRIGRADVAGVRALTRAEQRDRRGFTRHEKHSGTFTDIDAVAIAAERIAVISGERLQRVEAVDRHFAERV